jgi:hypothetical protein
LAPHDRRDSGTVRAQDLRHEEPKPSGANHRCPCSRIERHLFDHAARGGERLDEHRRQIIER